MWILIEPLLPPWPEKAPGPLPVADRLCLQGILYILYNDIAWQLLSLELGFGSGQTCWRRLERWQQAGVFDELHRILLAELNAAGELDWSRACVDGSHIRAKKGEPTPVRRRSTAGRRVQDVRDAVRRILRIDRHIRTTGLQHRKQLSGPRRPRAPEGTITAAVSKTALPRSA
ncbi:transposase, partial [Streptomyces spectabilis]|uniref:transposase n=1 Tax=Streptomyces spectabilis TaxID=68270 RepID=UPI0033E8A8B7